MPKSQAAFDALPMGAHRSAFGLHPCGAPIDSITLKSNRFAVRILTLGATLQAFWIDGVDIVLGFESVQGYLGDRKFFGATVGRYANRIKDGRFKIGAQTYQIGAPQDHALHGGPQGFDLAIWQVEAITPTSVTLKHESAAGDQGFPANVIARVTYALTEDGLAITHHAEADAPTPNAMTNHAYLNLGVPMGEHHLRVAASRYLPADGDGIPLGDPAPVDGTPLDFQTGRTMGAAIDAPQMAHRFGYDHNLCLDPGDGFADGLREVAELRGGAITLHLWTDQPGLQVYSGNFIGDEIGKYGQRHARRCAMCLEPQAWPDSPNHPEYPFRLTSPQAPHVNRIEWRFGR